jgi:DNA-binding transcriptional regulator YiaG
MDRLEEVEAVVRLRALIDSGAAQATRKAARLSLSEMARPMDVRPSTVLRWETGSRSPRGDHALRYLELLDKLMSR